jgi:allantoinase
VTAVTDGIVASDADDRLYPFSALTGRPPLSWPGSATVAFYPIVLVEHYEDDPPEGSVIAGDVFGGLGPGGALRRPQVTRVGNRDYGHRVGFFRLMETLGSLGIPPVIAIDAMAAEAYPAIRRWIVEHDAEVLAHGISISRAITSAMAPEDERAYITEAKSRIETALGVSTRGWLGPASSESGRSLQLLVDAGFDYCLDWPNDEQPLLSLPPFNELSDNTAINQRGLFNEAYARHLVDAATRLVQDGATSGRLLSFTLNPYTSGQPARMRYVKGALAEIVAMPGVWSTTPAVVAGHLAVSGGSGA